MHTHIHTFGDRTATLHKDAKDLLKHSQWELADVPITTATEDQIDANAVGIFDATPLEDVC